MKIVIAVILSAFVFGATNLGAYTVGNNYEKCYKDAEAIVNFSDVNIANTPDPQYTFETGIYVSRTTGKEEKYNVLLGRIADYATNYC